jgi:glutamine amidotransferase
MTVAIVDYGSGNLRSAAKSFERASAEAGLGLRITVTDEPGNVAGASHVVLPGVGAFADCMGGLESISGMTEAIDEAVNAKGRPFLGICVGMQLMATCGLEGGRHEGLGWIAGQVGPLAPSDETLKIPHMGWNDLDFSSPHPFFEGLETGAHAYFVHTYGFACENAGHSLASVDYGGEVTAVVGRDNLLGTQFHPEKSQATGLCLIANFLRWRP